MSKNQFEGVYDTYRKKTFTNSEKWFEDRRFTNGDREAARKIIERKFLAASSHLRGQKLSLLVSLNGREMGEDVLKRSINVLSDEDAQKQFQAALTHQSPKWQNQ